MSMKVKDLKEYLNNLSSEYDDCLVICQKDPEGNGYSPLSDADENAMYLPNSTWSGDVFDTRWSAEDACMSKQEWEDMKKTHPRCILLCPVN